MNIQIPPVIFYAVGAVLVVFGALRAYFLGWKQRERLFVAEPAERDPTTPDSEPRTKGQKRHMMFGVLWVLMGLFLIVSTIIQVRRG